MTMKVCMFTNTYIPQIGGVARSVLTLAEDLQNLGHSVLIVAPTYAAQQEAPEPLDALRVPAIQNFNGSDFSLRIPLPFIIRDRLDAFRPDLIHSHHPYLLGDAALREARRRSLPLVFTHHTLYEAYTHYVPLDSKAMKRFVVSLSTAYANLCAHVVAPSRSIAELLKSRGVRSPIAEIPTGVDLSFFAGGARSDCRSRCGLEQGQLVIGHVGRLAPEKNLDYLALAVCLFLDSHPSARFLVAGSGPGESRIREVFHSRGHGSRLLAAGSQSGEDLRDCYAAMDLFVFSSKTETQGMVLAEAMAAGLPVIALDAAGSREVVRDGENGRLLPPNADAAAFARAMEEFVRDPVKAVRWRQAALQTASAFCRRLCASRMTELYETILDAYSSEAVNGDVLSLWDTLLRSVKAEWDLISEKATATLKTIRPEEDEDPD